MMRLDRWILVAAVVVLCAMGCDRATNFDPGAETWQLEDTPQLEIGSDGVGDGDLLFGVRDVRVLPSEELLITEGGSRQVLMYSPEGTRTRTLGRRGNGPGEFQSVSWSRPLGDTAVVVFDPGNLRMTRFATESDEISTWTITPPQELLWTTVVAPFSDRTLLVSGYRASGEAEGGRSRPSMRFMEHSWSGEPGQVLVPEAPGAEVYRGELNSTPVQTTPVFSLTTFAAVGSEFLVVGTNEGPFLKVVNRSEGVISRIEWDQDPVPLEDWHLNEVVSARTAVASSADESEALRQVLEGMPVPDHLPWYDQVVVSDEDEIWVREYPEPGSESTWWRVLDVEGGVLGVIEIPVAFELKHVTGGLLAGVWTDELGVETVRVWRFLR